MLQAEACNSIKKETLAQVFPCKFCEIFKNAFFTEYLWATTSEHRKQIQNYQELNGLFGFG